VHVRAPIEANEKNVKDVHERRFFPYIGISTNLGDVAF
jgi:hypothetical protein